MFRFQLSRSITTTKKAPLLATLKSLCGVILPIMAQLQNNTILLRSTPFINETTPKKQCYIFVAHLLQDTEIQW